MSIRGENEEEAAARIETSARTIRQIILAGVVLLALLGGPVLIVAIAGGS